MVKMICNILFIGTTARRFAVAALLLCCACIHGYGQEQPPRPITVTTTHGLTFGAFFQGASGGTVTVSPDDSRSVTGDLVQANLGIPFSAALFEIDANVGTIISILNGPDVALTGSNGGSISLHVGIASVNSIVNTTSFTTTAIPPARTEVRVGGTLTVGAAPVNPAGVYSGSFSVIFMQQ